MVGLVDLFVNLCFRDFKEHDNPAKMALNKITEFHSDKFDAKFIDSLYEVLVIIKRKWMVHPNVVLSYVCYY